MAVGEGAMAVGEGAMAVGEEAIGSKAIAMFRLCCVFHELLDCTAGESRLLCRDLQIPFFADGSGSVNLT